VRPSLGRHVTATDIAYSINVVELHAAKVHKDVVTEIEAITELRDIILRHPEAVDHPDPAMPVVTSEGDAEMDQAAAGVGVGADPHGGSSSADHDEANSYQAIAFAVSLRNHND